MIKILNETENYALLETNYIGHLAYIYRNRPFIAPITYFFDKERNIIIGYSAEGHKITAMRKINEVALEVSEIDSVNHWNTIVVHGTYQELDGSNAKAYLHDFSLGVKDLIIRKEQRKLDFINQFSSKIYKDDMPIVFLIKIEEVTGRMRRS
ncbi:pyridoxamine 5'-phosphate oxidase family protein [Kordia sp. YSTF-M3]|uniref:Pyridoxamine 5'-phosphate oxidase family protein n=1 Tax=Kordia aestuariivivens TaxID=2759037 RepID=A0ABR7QF59_9FLAO|nr:pyridoxamine 5'-phosphate oxidase family protein [Kordia aestuariivivens]MBC8757058.1 pyridoxamine 5'-phosphate oxidase family protein [Kordia aestuariivivens]